MECNKRRRDKQLKKLIKPAQGFIIITCIFAVIFFFGRFGALDLDTITPFAAVAGLIISGLYIWGGYAVFKVLGEVNEN